MSWKLLFLIHSILLATAAGVMLPHPLTFGWPLLLTGVGAFLVVPWVLYLLPKSGHAWLLPTISKPLSLWGLLVCATCLLVSLLNSPSGLSGAFAVPWFAFTVRLGLETLLALHKTRRFDLASVAVAVGCLQLSIGAAWLLADRFAWQPLGFDPVIVRLTAAHFHFAGFLLPVVAGWTVQEIPGRWLRWAVGIILVGVLLVATGITCTRMGLPVAIESVLALVFSIGVLVLAIGICRLGWQQRNGFLHLSGISLAVGMLFASAYALSFLLRFSLPILQLPFMWAIHGSIQVFGFALLGLVGWQMHWGKRPRGASGGQQIGG
jgi:cytochrome b561